MVSINIAQPISPSVPPSLYPSIPPSPPLSPILSLSPILPPPILPSSLLPSPSPTPNIQVFGSGLIGFGSYLINLGTQNNFDEVTGNEFVSGAAILVVAGGITFILALIAILGAIFMWRPLLLIVSDVLFLQCRKILCVHG